MSGKNEPNILKTSSSLPTTSELAMITASLASAKGKDDYAKLAKQALYLWHICADTIALEKDVYEKAAERAPKDLELYGKLDKETYTLDELLRQGFKKKRSETERMSAFRKFLNVWLRIQKARDKDLEQCFLPVDQREDVEWSTLDEPSLDERNAALKTYGEQGFDKGTYCLMLSTIESYLEWVKKERASKGGKGKAAKSKGKK